MHVESNHAQDIIQQIPKTIIKYLCQLSSNEEIFNESARFYEGKLQQSCYQQKLKYPVKVNTHNKGNHEKSNLV